MKKSTVLALVAILGFGCTSAQKNGVRRQMSVPQQVNNLKKELKLTDEQTENITVLYTDFKKKMKSAGENSREQMNSNPKELDEQVQALLTDKQKKRIRKCRQSVPVTWERVKNDVLALLCCRKYGADFIPDSIIPKEPGLNPTARFTIILRLSIASPNPFATKRVLYAPTF